MLPQLPFDLPFDISLGLPVSVPSPLPTLGEIPGALTGRSPWTWVLAGAALAVVSLWAIRRARRMVVAATLGVAGLLVAWNAGFLPLSA